MADPGAIKNKGVSRRRFMGDVLKTACGVGLFGLGLGLYSNRASSLPANFIRPPGALPEDEFLSTCERSFACKDACPHDAIIKAAPTIEGIAGRTPVLLADQRACQLCEVVPCVLAGPSGALRKISAADIDLGTAVISPELCLNYRGEPCGEAVDRRARAGLDHHRPFRAFDHVARDGLGSSEVVDIDGVDSGVHGSMVGT